ncbi:MAG: hypothetical protein AAGK02_13485 [Pseudomonadota bacterium]
MADQDIEESQELYSGFIGSLKWIVPLIAVITLFVVMLIAP